LGDMGKELDRLLNDWYLLIKFQKNENRYFKIEGWEVAFRII
jgi:hypothetical protein